MRLRLAVGFLVVHGDDSLVCVDASNLTLGEKQYLQPSHQIF